MKSQLLSIFFLYYSCCCWLEIYSQQQQQQRIRKNEQKIQQFSSSEIGINRNRMKSGGPKRKQIPITAQKLRLNPSLEIESDAYLTYEKHSKSQCYEDIWIYENWFYGMSNGIIVESGALDGKLYSTSSLFTIFAQWSAIHIEADPENFAELQQNRPNSINIHAALCAKSKPLHWINIGGKPMRGFYEFMSSGLMQHPSLYNNETALSQLPVIHCRPLQSILNELNIHHINLWVLDVEGAEESVLRGIDFTSIKIDTIAMECDDTDLMKNQKKIDILSKNQYQCRRFKNNCMCIHESFQPHKSKRSTVHADAGCWQKTKKNKNVGMISEQT